MDAEIKLPFSLPQIPYGKISWAIGSRAHERDKSYTFVFWRAIRVMGSGGFVRSDISTARYIRLDVRTTCIHKVSIVSLVSMVVCLQDILTLWFNHLY